MKCLDEMILKIKEGWFCWKKDAWAIPGSLRQIHQFSLVESGTQKKTLAKHHWAIRLYSTTSKLLPEQEFLPQIWPFWGWICGHVSQPHLAVQPGGNPKAWVPPPKASQLFHAKWMAPSKWWINKFRDSSAVQLAKRKGMGGHPNMMKILDMRIRISDD